MTDETRAALSQASAALAAARENAERAKESCLEQIAADLPSRAAESARRVATAQPEVTKKLGKDGVATMRAALKTASEELGLQLIAAKDEIDWPLGTRYKKIENWHIRGALFNTFHRRTGALSAVLSDSGYKLDVSDPFLPQYLYTESTLSKVAGALSALGAAIERLDAAKRADDNSTVDEIWGL
ncbi:hypothetical protein MT355_10760 [Rathayibacter sp. VKM Ac-2929]|uniref:hypothetical protein n=1 Tax=Rathayibacter sp. VKM Ac-2929 TaxID=2929480 RepID=UPI001FB4ECD6|nr:hypothetical protein [Rathayibacter sp. VKM Ac-2929]MCJ1673733.1 hypothetical protein [Rathayibacter sp. VKM Ac-2929]